MPKSTEDPRAQNERDSKPADEGDAKAAAQEREHAALVERMNKSPEFAELKAWVRREITLAVGTQLTGEEQRRELNP